MLLLILLPSCMFLSFTNVFKSQYLIPNKLDNKYTIALFTGAVVNLIVNALLIPRYASVGVAWGTLLAEMSVTVMITIIMSRRTNVWRYYQNALPFFISGVVMFMTCHSIHIRTSAITGLLIKILIAALVYLGTLALLISIAGKWFGITGFTEMISQFYSKILHRRKNNSQTNLQ